MGLIKAGIGALGGVLADQWKEFFYSDALPSDVLVKKGQKKTSERSSNTKGDENIISNGSGIAVADGQCMMIVESGKVVEVCAEPGTFTYDSSTEPSIFAGSLGKSILDTFKSIGKRFTYGGDTGKDQRIYYFNTKEIIANKFGTPAPVPFRVTDKNIGLDMDISVRCNGTYSYKITNPILFYTNVCGNVEAFYTRDIIEPTLKSEFLSALQPGFAKISALGIRYSALPGHTTELADAMNATLSAKWGELRGISVISVAINSITACEEDEEIIKQAQRNAILRDPTMAAATLAGAQADAMKAAAENKNGAVNGFMGFGMAQNAGGANMQSLYAIGQAQQQEKREVPAEDGWSCSCGKVGNMGKFCSECGMKKPEEGWKCSCGEINRGKFCSECGTKKPDGAPLYRCDKCGFEPEDPKNPPKFCPECGDRFDDDDVK